MSPFRKLVIATALVLPMAFLPAAQAHAMPVIISVGFAPPVLPVYVQPYCPGDGYIWTPGYWAYGDEGGYYWVPGVWVMAPQPGYLWTPAYWGWENGVYLFHGGYWGEHVGYYGGINYGFGYGGFGFGGGEWRGGHFFYNSAVVRFGGGFHATNVYVRNVTVVNHTTVAFNGGPGGVQYHARPEEMAAAHENHIQPTGEQMSHEHVAATTPAQRFSANGGHPGVTAAATPAAFHSNPTGGGRPMGAANGARPTPGNTPANRPATPATQNHTQPQPQSRPQPQTQSRPAPQTQSHPAPQPQSHPAPQSRPAPQAQSHPQPAAHPAPQEEKKH